MGSRTVDFSQVGTLFPIEETPVSCHYLMTISPFKKQCALSSHKMYTYFSVDIFLSKNCRHISFEKLLERNMSTIFLFVSIRFQMENFQIYFCVKKIQNFTARRGNIVCATKKEAIQFSHVFYTSSLAHFFYV